MSASDAYVLVQTTIVDSMVTAWGTASEDDTTVWASGAFTSGQERHRVETHRVYRRITDGTDAPGEYPENYPERWQNRRATNRIAMFDGEGATAAQDRTVVEDRDAGRGDAFADTAAERRQTLRPVSPRANCGRRALSRRGGRRVRAGFSRRRPVGFCRPRRAAHHQNRRFDRPLQ